MNKPFKMKINKIQPSQLYLNFKKINALLKNSNFNHIKGMEPIPIKKLNNQIIFTDGHTRAYLYWKNGCKKILVSWEDEDLDWDAYQICVEWCKDAGIKTISDLGNRVIDNNIYQEKWLKRCQKMQEELEDKRKKIIKNK